MTLSHFALENSQMTGSMSTLANENFSLSTANDRDEGHFKPMKKTTKSQVLEVEQHLRELFGKLDSDYITALAPGYQTSPPSCAFHLVRLLFSCFLLLEIVYQLVADWRVYRSGRFKSRHDCELNVTCMLMVQIFGLTGIWGPKFSSLAVFFFIRLIMAIDMLKRDDLYLLRHTTATIFAAVYMAMCYNSIRDKEFFSQLLNSLSPVPAPTSDSYKPFSSLSYNLIRTALAVLFLFAMIFDMSQLVLQWNGKIGLVVEHVVYNLWLLFGMHCSFFGHFHRMVLNVWLIVCFQGNNLFSFTIIGLLTTSFFVFQIFQAYMIWKIAGKPFFIKLDD